MDWEIGQMGGQLSRVTVMGLGYIGLPTAAVLARAGHTVQGVDVTQRVVDKINAGQIHIEETDLVWLVRDMVDVGRLRASIDVLEADVYLIAVPTPLTGHREPDVSYVEAAVRAVAPTLTPGCCVIIESTSPVGTTELAGRVLRELRPDLAIPETDGSGDYDIALAYCPERVLPGRIIVELVSNDRVIGGMTPACAERAREFYETFVEGRCIPTTARTAEAVKLVENSFRDVNIAFANELSMIAEQLEFDVWDVIRLANRHPRVNILQPGPGVGGHCIAVDPWFLVASAPERARLIRTAREVNDHKAEYVTQRLCTLIEAAPASRIALLGLAFKPNVDDLRESPALAIAIDVAEAFGDRVLCAEPFVEVLPASLADRDARLVPVEEALAAADIVAILVDHDRFKELPASAFAGKTVLDTRGMLVEPE
jgi:UDP-N-acetyl-D-mannosaminuronic acid dehydrogenase